MELNVTKRDGTKENLDPEKINKILLWSVEGIAGVSASDVAMNAHLQFHNGITTEKIHNVLIQSAVDLISAETPNYQYVASNLLNYLIRKNIFRAKEGMMPSLLEVTKNNANDGYYDTIIFTKYTDEEFEYFNKYMKHDRDFDLTYAGLQQLVDKYLVKDRTTGKSFETPQYAFMLIAMTAFQDYGSDRKERVKKLYDLISTHKISLPTPIMAGVRTPSRQFSSCTLINIGDSLDSIDAGDSAILRYVAKRAGIGIDAGAIRAMGDKVRNGEVMHTGVIPFLKKFQSTLHSCSQGGIRKGSATVYFPIWHKEIEDILVLKNNKGTDDNRVRHMDYAIQFSKLFYQRFISNESISLFSPNDVPGLHEAFGDNEKFDELYTKYEANRKIPRKTVKMRDLMNSFAQERIGTGRMYVHNIDNTNMNSPFVEKIYQSNLCVEVALPTTPLSNYMGLTMEQIEELPDEIALCTLAAFNLGTIKSFEELEECADYIVRLLDYVIENQDYPHPAAKKMLKRRSIGVGVTNFAYWLAKNDLKYSDPAALPKVDEMFEHIQYYLIKASNELAKELGACEWFDRTTYAQGIMPIDRYNKAVDELVTRPYSCDWHSLRESVKTHGMRNSVLTALMPAESSAVVQNATNGLEPIRSLITIKKSKTGVIKQVAPEITKLKNRYEFAFDMPDNIGYTNIVAVIQKYIDQAVSANHYYNYTSEGISMATVIKNLLHAYKYGLKTLYYANTNDGKTDEVDESGCESGACSV